MGNSIPLSRTTKFVVDNRGRTAPTSPTGIALIATNCINNNRLFPSYETTRYVSKETYSTWFRSHPLPGDIILTLKGSQNGAVCLVPDTVDFVIAQDMVALRADEAVVDPLFLFAALRSDEVQEQIKNLDVSGIIPHFKKTDFDKLMLPFPDRKTQEFIGKFYYLLSAKIELNRRTNETLEAMAKALFKSWFVDFDPVHEKAAGRPPAGLDPDTAKLFPDCFEDSPLGKIPKGWQVTRWGEIISLEYGKSLRDYGSASGAVPVFGTNGPIGWYSEALCKHAGIVIGRKGAYRGVHYSPVPFFVIDTAFYVKPRTPTEMRWAYYEMLGLNINGMDSGSAIPSTSRDDFYSLPVVQPPYPIQQRFAEAMTPLWDRQESNERESRTLAGTRDALLPKLLSGELRV